MTLLRPGRTWWFVGEERGPPLRGIHLTADSHSYDPAANNSATDNRTVITPTADLSITKSDGVVAVNQSGAVIYAIVASDAGPSSVSAAPIAHRARERRVSVVTGHSRRGRSTGARISL